MVRGRIWLAVRNAGVEPKKTPKTTPLASKASNMTETQPIFLVSAAPTAYMI
jgi:hypothetical protein